MGILLSVDQGTTGTTSVVMEESGRVLGRATVELPQHFPVPGQVEHEPDEIWETVLSAVGEALASAGVRGQDVAAVGITNQRETTVVWDRATGRPIHRAIVWQDRRTSRTCADLRQAGFEEQVEVTTGLVLDPYFSGTKIAWILDHVDQARQRAERGGLAFGTIDSYLVFRLCGGAEGGNAVHVTDVTNASRTLLMNLATLDWDQGMLDLLRVPRSMLPRIVGCAEHVGHTRGFPHVPDGTPITGLAGDQHAALFGQGCFGQGEAKCTYGTGAFILANTGTRRVRSRHGLLSTVAFSVNGSVSYALEGSAFVAGAAVQWLRDGLGILRSAKEIEGLARSVPSSEGVTFVPALSGLGAPYWDPEARGVICGITRGTTAAHLARATLEAIALEVDDLLRAAADDLGAPILCMRVDGGAAENNLLMELQAGVSNIMVERPVDLESTARGAAMLAGVGARLFRTLEDARTMAKTDRVFSANMSEEDRAAHRRRWADAITRARSTSLPIA